MSFRADKFPGIMRMIQKYEYKYKRPMTIQVLLMYISEALKISEKTAKEYIEDLKRMGYIEIKDYKIFRGVNAT